MNNNINEIILSVADNFRVGCASIGLIMTEARGKVPAQQMNDIRTEISLSEALIVELTAKIFDYEARILAATEKQISAKAKAVDAKAKAAEKIRQILEKIAPLEAQYAELEPRQDEAVLSETAKAYCIKKIKSKMHPHRSPELRTKEIRKGKEVEAKAIEFLESVFGEMELGYGFLTDTKTYTSDGFVHGECDIWLKDKKIVLDTKCSYDISTFPFFDAEIPEAAYAWQMQGYAAILGAEKMQVVYVLMNTPIDILEESARFQLGKDFSQEAWEAYVAYHTYDHLPQTNASKFLDLSATSKKLPQSIKGWRSAGRLFVRLRLKNTSYDARISPFKVEDGALIGIDREGFAAFFLLVLSECKRGKIYRFRAEEVKSSGVQKNYYFANLDLAAQAIGLTAVSLEYHLKEVVKTWAISGEYPDFLRDEWTNQIVSLKTGEVTYEIKTFSSWTTSMLSSFIDVLEHVAKDMIDGFKMLDPKTYGITAKGEKRQLPNVNKTWKIAK